MKVLITGASGMVGTKLVQELQSLGHATFKLQRSPSSPPGDNPTWDPARGVLDPEQLEGFDAVVHLAGENVGAGRWNAERKRRIRDSRIDSTKLLSEALAQLQHPPAVMICASAVGFYGDRGEELLEEQSSVGSGFLSRVCEEWEAAARATREKGIRTVHLRFGVILSAEGGPLLKMLPAFRCGLGGRVGDGQQYMSWVTLGDATGVIRYALENQALAGPVNVVAPQSIQNVEFTRVLAAVLRRPAWATLPAWGVRMLLGEMGDELLLASTRVVPRVLLQSGYVFQSPELEAALSEELR